MKVMQLFLATTILCGCLGEPVALVDVVVTNNSRESLLLLIAREDGQSASGFSVIPNDGQPYRSPAEELGRRDPGSEVAQIFVFSKGCKLLHRSVVSTGHYLVQISSDRTIHVEAMREDPDVNAPLEPAGPSTCQVP